MFLSLRLSEYTLFLSLLNVLTLFFPYKYASVSAPLPNIHLFSSHGTLSAKLSRRKLSRRFHRGESHGCSPQRDGRQSFSPISYSAHYGV
jgi:hypothetical protein